MINRMNEKETDVRPAPVLISCWLAVISERPAMVNRPHLWSHRSLILGLAVSVSWMSDILSNRKPLRNRRALTYRTGNVTEEFYVQTIQHLIAAQLLDRDYS